MLRRFDPRIVLGIVLLLGGALLLMQTLGLLQNATDWFWGALFIVAGLAFLSLLMGGNWWAVFPGMTLLALGVSTLLPDSLENIQGLIFLGGIGLAFWIVYLMDRSKWWALIPAGALTTLAVVSTLPDRLGSFETGGVFFLGLGLTFLLVALLGRMGWAYYPAAALGIFGLLTTASLMSFANYIWAAALIIAGGYLIIRYFIKRPQ